MIGVQLSLEISGGRPQICKKNKITEKAFLWIRDHKLDFLKKKVNLKIGKVQTIFQSGHLIAWQLEAKLKNSRHHFRE